MGTSAQQAWEEGLRGTGGAGLGTAALGRAPTPQMHVSHHICRTGSTLASSISLEKSREISLHLPAHDLLVKRAAFDCSGPYMDRNTFLNPLVTTQRIVGCGVFCVVNSKGTILSRQQKARTWEASRWISTRESWRTQAGMLTPGSDVVNILSFYVIGER